MLNTVYRLKAPRQFEICFDDIELSETKVIVRPTYLSICNADQRYYQGKRDEKVLKQKLPMALIHEGIGKVVFDPTGTFEIGQDVVMIPNTPTEKDPIIAENYLRSSKFRASGFDGFLQEYIQLDLDRCVALPEGINKTVAAFTELVSVSYHAIARFEDIAHQRREAIGVWGDGNLGYITALLFKKIMPDSKVYVFGKNENKLADFTFADEVYNITEMPDDLKIDHAFECVGGAGSGKAINQIIDYINPEGTISILGVSEELVPINTRMVLEKGLRIYGSSRSGRSDFAGLMELYKEHPDIVAYLENIVGTEIRVRELKDIKEAFEIDMNALIGKTVMVWDE